MSAINGEAKELIEMLVGLASRAGWKGTARMARDGEGYVIALRVHRRPVELSERESKRRQSGARLTMVSKRIPSMADPLVCETCRAAFELTNPTDIDGSFTELLAADWMHFARKGIARERWAWKCTACKPQGNPQTSGLTTARMMSPEKG